MSSSVSTKTSLTTTNLVVSGFTNPATAGTEGSDTVTAKVQKEKQ